MLSDLVSCYQNAFVPGRSIVDNILITHIVEYLRKKKKGKVKWAALKLDMSKAYDKVSWLFLIEVLKKMGFSERDGFRSFTIVFPR